VGAHDEKHGLKTSPSIRLVAWPFADYVFSSEWTSCRHHQEPPARLPTTWVDSEAMFERLLRRFRREKIVP